jgi:hypothetical protein
MTNDKLERQVEDGNLFTHSALSQLAERLNRVESLLYALADLCVDKNLGRPYVARKDERCACVLRS